MDRTKLILSMMIWFFVGSVGICLVGLLFSWEYGTLIGCGLNVGALFAEAFGMVGYLIYKANHPDGMR